MIGNGIKDFTYALDHLHPISLSLNALAATADVTIAVTMCIILRGMGSGFARANNVLATLIVRMHFPSRRPRIAR